MTDKLTDEQIIKALECLHKRILHSKFAEDVTEKEIMALVEVADLINRQKAEIETLKTNNTSLCVTLQSRARVERAEAIKAFAERLKEKFVSRNTLQNAMVHAKVDNLVKEMVGE